jgi:hypothetical protein
MEMKTGEILAAFVVATVISVAVYSLVRKKEVFAVYDEQGNLISTQVA